MRNLKVLEEINKASNIYRNTDDKLYSTFKESYYDTHFADWSSANYYLFRDLLFKLITGEGNFDDFYERFGSPGLDKGKKPIAWSSRFLPDEINDLLISTKVTTKEKVQGVQELYKKCIKLEKAFSKRKR